MSRPVLARCTGFCKVQGCTRARWFTCTIDMSIRVLFGRESPAPLPTETFLRWPKSCTLRATTLAARPANPYRARMLKFPYAGAVAGLLLTSACGQSSPLAAGSLAQHQAAPAPASPVVEAWNSAQEAFETASWTADPWSPALSATTTYPALGELRGILIQMHESGQIARGPVSFGSPSVQMEGSRRAVVRSCLNDGEVVITQSTGDPVPGPMGEVEFEAITSVMQWTAAGWVLTNQSVEPKRCNG